MTIRFTERVKIQDLAVGDLELDARVGEGFIIKSIGIDSGADGLVSRLLIGDELMTGIPADSGEENVVPVKGKNTNTWQLIETLRKRFPELPEYKVSEGEKLVLTSDGSAGVGYIFFQQLGAEQIPRKEDPGGSRGKDRLFVSHGQINQNVAATTTEDIVAAVSLNPTGLPDFPFGALVPAFETFELMGFSVSTGAASGANITFDGLKLWKRNESILARDEQFVEPSIFPYNKDDIDKPMFRFPVKYVFGGNEELKVEARITNAAGAPELAEIFFTFFFRRLLSIG